MNYDLLGHALTASSLLIAVVTFAIGFLSKSKADRLSRTLEFLRTIYEDEGPIRQANLETALWLSSNEPIESGTALTEEKEAALITILDYFDLVSDSADRGIVDSEMIVVHLGGKMRSMYELTKGYINSRREVLGRPGIYGPLEKFVLQSIRDRIV